MNLTYSSLFLSVALAIFYRSRQMAYACMAITVAAAIHEQVITTTALVYLSCLLVLVLAYYNLKVKNNSVKILGFTILASVLGGFALHHIPGFTTWLAIDHIKISAAARSYTMHLHFDKVIAGLIVYTFGALITTEKAIDKAAFQQTALILIACVLAILGPALWSGYTKFDPKIPSILPIWAINNFLVVCFSEEVIFRGFLQTAIQKYLPKSSGYIFLSIVSASIIFGLSHYKDGATFMALAAICGLFYGYAYHKTRRILCAMLVHFVLNLTHILMFTYP